MTPEQFCYWLQGLMEAPVKDDITLEHCRVIYGVIYNKLKEVNQQQVIKENKNECKQ